MANSAQAGKRARQADKRHRHKAGLRSLARTVVKKVAAAIEAGKAKEARAAFESAVPVLDRMAAKGVIHKNKAARHKSRLNERIQAMGGKRG